MTRTASRPRLAGAVLPETRAGVAILLALSAVNGLLLYLFPGHADTNYAWSIKPPPSAAFLGAGYVAGTIPTALVVFATRRWRSLRTLPWALFVLSTALLAATIIHNDRFRFDFPPTYAWIVVYAGVVIGAPVLWLRQERRAEPEPPADPGLRVVRAISLPVGIVMVAGAAALFLAPVDLGSHWLWTLTPLLGRVVASWYAMFGTMLIACAVGIRHPSDAFMPYATLAAWSMLLLAIPVFHTTESGAALWIYAVGMAALLALSAAALARAAPGLRAARL